MNVAFLVGEQSKVITNTLKKLADDIDYFVYNSLEDMIKESNIRHLFFGRIVFSTNILRSTEVELTELNEYIRNYSDSTEVVMIMNKDEKKTDEIFLSIFNSPLYTPVILERTTPTNLLETVKSNIVDLKAKYYVLDIKKDKVMTTTNADSEEEKVQDKKDKKGFISSLMGGKKKNNQKDDLEDISEELEEYTSSILDIPPENSNDFSSGPKSLSITGMQDTEADSSSVLDEMSKKEESVLVGSSPNSFSEQSEDLSNVTDEEDDMSIGDYGSLHSDTTDLDDDAEEELKKFAEQKENSAKKQDREEKPILQEIKPKKKTNVIYYIGNRGMGISQLIVDDAGMLVHEQNKKVLILDLNQIDHSVLSFLEDTEKFYQQGNSMGISKHRVYLEDGIGIISNGYGMPLQKSEVKNLMKSNIVDKYDFIIVDCPTDSLNLLDIDLINGSTIRLMTNNDRSDLFALSLAITNRNLVTLEVEKYIMNNCNIKVVDNKIIREEDIIYLKDKCLFANGCWLDKIVKR